MPNEINALNTRGEIATAVGLKLQDTSTNRATIIKTDLDEGYREALRRHPWPQAIRWLDASVTMAASDAYFFLPKDTGKILRVVNASIPSMLDQATVELMIDSSGGFSSISGVPCSYARVGNSAINTTLVAGTALEILSDGSDTRTGLIEGTLSGEQKRTSFTLNGATPVALGSWDEVTQCYLASMSSSTGRTVTVRKDVGDVTVATIGPYENKAVYQRYRVWPTPNASTTLRVIYRYSPPAILDDTHEYVIPIQSFLHDYAWARGLQQRREFAPAQDIMTMAESKLSMAWNESRGNAIDQYVPASPYWGSSTGFYIGAFPV